MFDHSAPSPVPPRGLLARIQLSDMMDRDRDRRVSAFASDLQLGLIVMPERSMSRSEYREVVQ